MELCKGFEDWLECLKCPHLCTKECPLEGENVMEEMKKQMRLLSIPGKGEDIKSFSK
jgi:hypothetical protein